MNCRHNFDSDIYEFEFDPNAVPEIRMEDGHAKLEFRECKFCATLYHPSKGHDCARLKPKSREEIIKGLLCCVRAGCADCPYSEGLNGRGRLLNGDFTKFGCKELLEKDATMMMEEGTTDGV